jgi:hypothetical protein
VKRSEGPELKAAFERERVAASLPDLGQYRRRVIDDADNLPNVRLADSRMYRDKLGEQPGASARRERALQ